MMGEESTTPEKMGARIKLARTSAGLTQDELARKLHIAPQSVGGWERGETSPRGHRLSKLAQILSVDATWLLLGPSDTTYPPQPLVTRTNRVTQRAAPEPAPLPPPAPVVRETLSEEDNLVEEIKRECGKQGVQNLHYHVPVQAALDLKIDILHPRVAVQVGVTGGQDWERRARSKLWGLMLLARMEDLIDLHRTRVLFLCGQASDTTTKLAVEGKLLGNEVLVLPDAQALCARLLTLIG